MEQTELTALIQKAQAGNRQAQEALLAEVQNRVYYHCKKMLKHDSDAQDAAQDVLITVLTSLDKLREPAAFYGWVNGITANRCKHLLTQSGREWQIPETEDGDNMLDGLEDMDIRSIPEAVLDNKETQRLMLELIDALPPEQRLSVLFYYYDEMSIKEIAQAMETSEGTVKSRLNYARKAIKAGVEDLERRGTKLYGVAPMPLLLLFLRRDAFRNRMTAAQSAQVSTSVLTAARTGTAGAAAKAGAAKGAAAKASAAGGTAAKAGAGLSVKLVAGVLAVAAVAGIAFGAVQLMKPDEPSRAEDDPPARSEQEDRPKREDGPEQDPGPADEGISPELQALLERIVYYGDTSQCKLTGEQAAVYADVIRQETDSLRARVSQDIFYPDFEAGAYAALFDVGDGTTALFFGGGEIDPPFFPEPNENGHWIGIGTQGIWQYQDGQAVPYAPEGMEPGDYWGEMMDLREGHLFIGGPRGSDGSVYDGRVYPLTGSTIPTTPQTSAGYKPKDIHPDPYDPRYTVDGAEVSKEEFEAWREQWEKQPSLCSHHWDGGVGGSFSGLGDAEIIAEALTQYAVETGAAGAGETPSPGTPGVQPYAQAYAQKVHELTIIDPNLTFDLVYIDRDDVPELLVLRSDSDISWVSLYTFAGNELYTLVEDLVNGIRGYLGYYPKENVVEYSSADLAMNQWGTSLNFYQINAEHQWKSIPMPDGLPSEMYYLRGKLSGEEILAQLEK